VFIDSDHSKTSVGLNSPGPVYEVASSLGKQLESRKESPTYVSFGSAKRFGKAREVKPFEIVLAYLFHCLQGYER
jgi:hypothetical protein